MVYRIGLAGTLSYVRPEKWPALSPLPGTAQRYRLGGSFSSEHQRKTAEINNIFRGFGPIQIVAVVIRLLSLPWPFAWNVLLTIALIQTVMPEGKGISA